MNTTKALLVSAAGSVLGTLLMGSVAFAQTTPAPTTSSNPHGGPGNWGGRGGMMMGRMPGVFGTVSAISGTTLTVTSKAPPRPQGANSNSSGTTPTATTFTVDASAATVFKENATSSVSAIAIGDTVMVQGTVSGTSITAKEIRDGLPPMGEGTKGARPQNIGIQGNGEPVIGGSVASVSGSTLSVTTAQGGITYQVDASNAIVKKGNATSTVSAITTGDKVVVQGTVNGTAVSASSVIDQGSSQGTEGQGGQGGPGRGGFIGMIQGFFQHLFGFF